jgi:hypothetical protein
MRYSPPIADGNNVVNKKDAINTDIISVLESNFSKGKAQCKQFAQNFVGATDEQTANNVWNYLRHKIKYKRDSEKRQQIRLPARLIADAATGADCKSFALFACCILANLGFIVGFRYASYGTSSTPTHVYCFASKNGRNYIVDGVWHTFNTEKFYTHKKDHNMQVETLSGFTPNRKRLSNTNDPAQLKEFYNKLSNKTSVVARLALKRLNPTGNQLSYTPQQLAHYKMVLQKALTQRPDAKSFGHQLIADELTRVNSGTVTGAILGYASVINGIAGKGKVKKFFKKVGSKVKTAVKKGSLAPMRGAFLGLVKLNAFGLAGRLNNGRKTDNAKYQKFWTNLGGSVKALDIAVTIGAKKKPLLAKKNKGVGVVAAGTLATAVALATPIIIIVSKLFHKSPGDPDINTGDVNSVLDELKAAGVSPDLIDSVKDLTGKAYAGGGDVDTKEYPDDPEKDTGIDFGGYLPWIAGAGLVYVLATSKGK